MRTLQQEYHALEQRHQELLQAQGRFEIHMLRITELEQQICDLRAERDRLLASAEAAVEVKKDAIAEITN